MHVDKRRRMEFAGENVSTDPVKEMQVLINEMEPAKPGMPSAVGYRPTYRAVLAKKGYLVRETIGSGTYSKVKKALNLQSGEHSKIAVKIIDRQKAPKDYQQRFLPRELKLWPQLRHPHIINLHEYFEDERRIYMVHEYADGGDVLKYVQSAGALSESMSQKWFQQIGDAVRYLHDRGIAHRDLKLENLLLDDTGNIKICDFGFVKEVKADDLSKTYCGSKSYAAPEVLIGKPYDPYRADVWAFGVILYILVTGKMPFDESKGNKSILSEQRAMDLYWPKVRKISQLCKDLIRYSLVFDFMKRPSIAEVLNHAWVRTKCPRDVEQCLPSGSETNKIGTNTEYIMRESH